LFFFCRVRGRRFPCRRPGLSQRADVGWPCGLGVRSRHAGRSRAGCSLSGGSRVDRPRPRVYPRHPAHDPLRAVTRCCGSAGMPSLARQPTRLAVFATQYHLSPLPGRLPRDLLAGRASSQPVDVPRARGRGPQRPTFNVYTFARYVRYGAWPGC